MTNEEKLARGLGWFSIGLGLTEIVATGALTRYFGLEKRTGLVRAFGFREIAAGVGILASSKAAPGLWARFGGDLIDLGALAEGLSSDNPKRDRVGVAVAVVAAITVLDAACAQRLSSGSGEA